MTYRAILRLVWPLALGMVNCAVMQFADRAFLAHESMASLEAVLPASMLAWIFLGFFQSLVGYTGVFVAQCHGAGDSMGEVRAYRAGLALAVISGVVMLPFLPLGDAILAHTASSSDIAMREKVYYDIVMLGSVFVVLQMAASSFFTGLGKTACVFWVNLGGNLLNVALDPPLIFGWGPMPRLGIAGAAYATVLALAAQTAVLFALAHAKTRGFAFHFKELPRVIGGILRFGIPSGGYSILNMLSFTLFVFVTGGVGDLPFAVSNACFSVNYLVFAPTEGFALGAQTLVGQARGAGDDDLARVAARRTIHLTLAFVVIIAAIILVFHRPILSIFAPSDIAVQSEFINLGMTLFLLMAAWLLFDAADVVYSGALRGAGDTRFVFWWMLVSAFLVWMPSVALVRHYHNTMPALWATLVGYAVFICIGSALRWHCGGWRKVALTFATAKGEKVSCML